MCRGEREAGPFLSWFSLRFFWMYSPKLVQSPTGPEVSMRALGASLIDLSMSFFMTMIERACEQSAAIRTKSAPVIPMRKSILQFFSNGSALQ